MSAERVRLLGVPFDRIGPDALMARIEEATRARTPFWISTANLDWLVTARRDPGFLGHLDASDVVTCDGAPVMHLSRIAGLPLPHRITGVEIFRRLRAGEAGRLRVGFFGAEAGEAQRASDTLNAEGGPLIGAGGHDPGHGSVEALSAPEHLDAVRAMKADVLILALGAAKGQDWIARNRAALGVPVISHLGAVVRHVSGDTPPAPDALAKTGFEWAHRAINEPALRARYAANFAALPGLIAAAARQRLAGSASVEGQP